MKPTEERNSGKLRGSLLLGSGYQEGPWKITWQNSRGIVGHSNTVTITENHCATAWHLPVQTGQHQNPTRTSHPPADSYNSHSCTAGSVLRNILSDVKEECKWSTQNEKGDRFFATWDGVS